MVTPGNHSTNCDTSAPSSRFSKSAATDTRVPRNTHAPLTRSGSRSTAGQVDQSIMRQILPLSGIRRPTLQVSGRRRTKCDGYRAATLLGVPLDLVVRGPCLGHRLSVGFVE